MVQILFLTYLNNNSHVLSYDLFISYKKKMYIPKTTKSWEENSTQIRKKSLTLLEKSRGIFSNWEWGQISVLHGTLENPLIKIFFSD